MLVNPYVFNNDNLNIDGPWIHPSALFQNPIFIPKVFWRVVVYIGLLGQF